MKITGSILAFGMILLLASCQKELSDSDITRYTNHPLNDTVWTGALSAGASVHELSQLIAPVIRIDSFDTDKDTTLVYGDSLDIRFTAGSCVGAGGAAVTGKVKLEIFWLKKKADFIRAFKQTACNDTLLSAKGVFFIRLTKEGKELSLAPGASVRVRIIDPEPGSSGITFNYVGSESNPLPPSGIDTSFKWRRVENTPSGPDFTIKPYLKPWFGPGIEFEIKRLRWFGIQSVLDSLRNPNSVKITTILPLNFTNKNTVVFAVFANATSVINLKADYDSRSFYALNFPRQAQIKLLSISKIGGEFYLGARDIVNPTESGAIYKLNPEKKSLQEIIEFLDRL